MPYSRSYVRKTVARLHVLVNSAAREKEDVSETESVLHFEFTIHIYDVDRSAIVNKQFPVTAAVELNDDTLWTAIVYVNISDNIFNFVPLVRALR